MRYILWGDEEGRGRSDAGNEPQRHRAHRGMNTEGVGECSGVGRDSEGFREEARRERLWCCFVDFAALRHQSLCIPPL